MSPIPLLSSYLANQKSRSVWSGMGDVGGMFFFFTILCMRACQSRDKKKSVRTKQYAFTRGRDVFTRGLYFFTRGLYFFTRGLYFFTRSEVLGSGTIGIRLSQRSMHQTLFYCIGLYGLFRTVRVRPYPSVPVRCPNSPSQSGDKIIQILQENQHLCGISAHLRPNFALENILLTQNKRRK